MMPPLWPLYTAAAGAPRLKSDSWSLSSEPCELCTNAVSRPASAELNTEAFTITLNACVMLPAFFNCTKEPLLAISFSRSPMARCKVSMISESSFDSAPKSAASLPRISVAALRSASSVLMSAESCSTLVLKELVRADSASIVAFKLETSPFPVLISKPRFLERSSHHSENSLYVFCAASPSPTILDCKSESNEITFPTGDDSPAKAIGHTARATNKS
mmetsp:Transcript_23071/g.49132  ORF Transcript_23071/g.49132 Transcript_23071/m.49132 type:complete len:218 (-) Transcript_23071:107-760(-)